MSSQKSRTKKVKVRRFYDYSLLFIIIFLTLFGLLMIYSSSSYKAQLTYEDPAYFLKRQGIISLGSFLIMLVVSKMDYHFFSKFAVFSYFLSYVLMILVNFTPLGIELNGKKRWLGVGKLTIQPTEFVKIALILMLAYLINKLYKSIDLWRVTGLMIALTVPIAGLVAMNNLSSGIIIVGIAFIMVFVASRKKLRYIAAVAAVFGVAFIFVQYGHVFVEMKILKSYQLQRIDVWLRPEDYPLDGGYQVLQGLYAIGSGGLFGKGLGGSIQKLGFVPEAQNDMIFSIICEELGLFGATLVILMFLFMIWRFMVIANNAPDFLGSLLVVGVMAHIAIQVVLNIAVVTNSMPNTGITLPFISYGGTSVLFLMVEMGMVLSVSNQIKLEK